MEIEERERESKTEAVRNILGMKRLLSSIVSFCVVSMYEVLNR